MPVVHLPTTLDPSRAKQVVNLAKRLPSAFKQAATLSNLLELLQSDVRDSPPTSCSLFGSVSSDMFCDRSLLARRACRSYPVWGWSRGLPRSSPPSSCTHLAMPKSGRSTSCNHPPPPDKDGKRHPTEGDGWGRRMGGHAYVQTMRMEGKEDREGGGV
jgi:hypothetical protein